MRSQRHRYWTARRLRAIALRLDAKALELDQRADLELELERGRAHEYEEVPEGDRLAAGGMTALELHAELDGYCPRCGADRSEEVFCELTHDDPPMW